MSLIFFSRHQAWSGGTLKLNVKSDLNISLNFYKTLAAEVVLIDEGDGTLIPENVLSNYGLRNSAFMYGTYNFISVITHNKV